jgi:8-oxo-dGTP pyrophosphatase MutT (NUDIX family)
MNILLIQRKDTIGYTDFIRGKYSNLSIAKLFLEEMTQDELLKIKNLSFKELWDDIFMNKNCKIYTQDYNVAYKKFKSIDIHSMIDDLILYTNRVRYNKQEYGFPKGRASLCEDPLDCAIREFEEETGYNKNFLNIKTNIIPFREYYMGVNNKEYICVYYIAEFKNEICDNIKINKNNILQSGEVKKVKWYPVKKAYKKFRDYHIIKKHILYKLYTFTKKN